jgi:hypothetical protein
MGALWRLAAGKVPGITLQSMAAPSMSALLSSLTTALKRLGLLALAVVLSFGLAACDSDKARPHATACPSWPRW